MKFKRKQIIIWALISMLLISIMPPFTNQTEAYISHIDDGLSIDHNKKYKIRDFEGNYDYFYRKRWEVRVDGAMQGYMALLMPKGDLSDQGRTFAHMDNVRQWATVFNGNPDYVYDDMSKRQVAIRSSSGETFNRPYSRYIAEASGALISVGGRTSDDGYVIIKTTSKPTVNISSPATNTQLEQDKAFNVTFNASEFVPSYHPDTIDYKISVDGHVKASGRINSSTGTKTESITISGSGTKRIHVSATDYVQRTSTSSVDVVIKDKTPIPIGQAFLEVEPPVQQVEVGQSAAYVANYYDKDGKKTIVTTNSGAAWSATNSTIGQLQTKGNFKGIKEGNTPIKVTYSGLTATAQLIVANTPPPPAPEPSNEPPTVEIQGPDEVMPGETFCLQADATDPDGTIEDYSWNYNGNGSLTDSIGCDLSYPTEGLKEVEVVVTDDKGAGGTDDHYINVIPPQPSANFSVSGTLKENRKVNLNPSHPYGNRNGVIDAFPMVEEKWTVTALSSTNQAGIKSVQSLNGDLTYQQVVNILMKKAGDYKVKRYVKNSIGLEDTVETTITIEPDFAPVANFSTVTVLYRDQVKATDADTSKAIIKATDFSYSRDDQISKRVWTISFDSNNNGDFADETPTVISNVNETEVQYVTDKVGKYKLELEAFEEFAQPTIDQFVDVTYTKASTDRRYHDTAKANPDKANVVKPLSERVIEVDNLAPTVSYDVQKRETVELQLSVGKTNQTKEQWNSKLNEYLLPKLNDAGYDLDLKLVNPLDSKMLVNNIASGAFHNLILSDGDVYGIGYNGQGQLGIATSQTSTFTKVPGLNTKIQSVSAGEYHTVLLGENGDVYAAGSNIYGQSGGSQNFAQFTKLNTPVKIRQVSAGKSHTVLLGVDGNVYTLGHNRYGVFGDGNQDNISGSVVKMLGISDVKDIRGGNQVSLMKKGDGSIWYVGLNANVFESGFEWTTAPRKVVKSTGTANFATNGYSTTYMGDPTVHHYQQSAFVHENGTADLTSAQVGFTSFSSEPISQVAIGREHMVLVAKSGKVYGYGDNKYGQMGNNKNPSTFITPTLINGVEDVVFASTNDYTSLFVLSDGTVKVVGGGGNGQLGEPLGDVLVPRVMETPNIVPLPTFSSSENILFTSLIDDEYNFPIVPLNEQLKSINASFIGLGKSQSELKVKEILNGVNGTFIENVDIDSSVKQVSDYILSQLGIKQVDLQIDVSDSPFTESQLKSAFNEVVRPLENEHNLKINPKFFTRYTTEVKMAGVNNTQIVDKDGFVYGWGVNGLGELGMGHLNPVDRPMKNPYLTNIVDVKSSGANSLYLNKSGEVFANGYNVRGEAGTGKDLSDGSQYLNIVVPQKVPGLPKIKAIAAGEMSGTDGTSFAIDYNGDVWSWGNNIYGNLGDGTTTSRKSPAKVANITNVEKISSDRVHTMAVTKSGEVYAWGTNENSVMTNQIPQNARVTPVKITGLPKIIDVDVDFHSSTFLTEAHTLYGVGAAYSFLSASIGSGNAGRISDIENIESISSNVYFNFGLSYPRTMFVKAGKVYAYGKNDYYQLGDGTTLDRNSFVPIAGLDNIRNVLTGDAHTVAVSKTGEVYTFGQDRIYNSNNLGYGSKLNSSPIKIPFQLNVNSSEQGTFENSENPLFTALLSDKVVDETLQTSYLKDINSTFIGIGKSAINKAALDGVRQVNKGGGTYLELPSATTDEAAKVLMKQMAEYIIDQMQSDKVDLVFGIGDTIHKDKAILQSKVNSIVLPKLNAEGIQNSSLNIDFIKINSNSTGELQWRHDYVNNINDTNWTKKTGVINAPIPKGFKPIGYDYSSLHQIFILNPLTGEVKKRAIATESEWTNNPNISNLPIPSGFEPLSFKYDGINQIYEFNIINPTTGELQGRSDYVNNINDTNWAKKTGVINAPIPKGFKPLGYDNNSLHQIFILNPLTGEVKKRAIATESEWTNNPNISNLPIPSGFEPLSFQYDGINQMYNFNVINNPSLFYKINASTNQTFAVVIEDSVISEEGKLALISESLINNAYISGLGTTINQSNFNDVISKNMARGTFINNTNLDTALSAYADYIIAEVAKKRGTQELYITLEEQLKYFTTYNDFEKDPKYQDRWKYDHLPTVFENDMGQDARQMRDMATPVDKFNKVGRYQPYYSSQDNPLTGLFPVDRVAAFEPYRKWAKDADNWFIYVHRKPVPEFSFTINGTTGDYTITNKAYDLDKQSIEIGFGPGLKSQKFQWREQGQTTWQDGVPTSPLARKVYEVQNTVVDFQKREESMVKLLDATGVNKPPVAIFEPMPYIVETEQDFDLLNTSYDPNGDNMTAEWYFKFEGDPDSAYYLFTTGKYTNQVPDYEWSTITSFLNEGVYDIKLVVKDSFGLSDSTERKVTVLTSNTAPVACMNIPTPNYIGDTIVIDNCATDIDNDSLSYTYTVQKQNGTEIITTGDPRINAEGDLTLLADQHPTDLGTWTVTQEVNDGTESANVTGSLVVLDQIVEGQVNHTEKWIENLQKFNSKNPSRAFNLLASNGLVEFVPGEKFILLADETEEATSVSAYIKEHRTNYGTANLNETTTLNLWNGSMWNESMIETFKDGEVLTFVFTATFANGWVDTDEVQVIINDDPYWRQHTTH